MLQGSKRVLLFDDAGYLGRMKTLFGSSIIGYWPMNEPNGAVALDYSGNNFHGAYTGVALGQSGIGDGLTCPLYDGTTSYMQPPAGFRTAFNNQELSILILINPLWAWNDGVVRRIVSIRVDGSNFAELRRDSANNGLSWFYTADGTSKGVSTTTHSNTSFFHMAMTVSKSGDLLRAYKAGTQENGNITGLGVWVGTPAAATTVVGALNTTPAQVVNGYLAHALILNRAATPAEVAAAASL